MRPINGRNERWKLDEVDGVERDSAKPVKGIAATRSES